jgi:predicted DNA-binding antitoxin AbrB/MazE fold protein
MTVKAIYEDGVFKPKEKVELEDQTEVELDYRTADDAEFENEDDPRSFVGFIKNAPKGVPIARDHDKYIYKR